MWADSLQEELVHFTDGIMRKGDLVCAYFKDTYQKIKSWAWMGLKNNNDPKHTSTVAAKWQSKHLRKVKEFEGNSTKY